MSADILYLHKGDSCAIFKECVSLCTWLYTDDHVGLALVELKGEYDISYYVTINFDTGSMVTIL